MPTLPITNLSKGELAPELQARIDTSQYQAGAKRMRNFIIQKYGGASFRPGFRYVGECDTIDSTPRYIPFQFNIEQAYVMVLDEQFMRLLANGGMVVEPADVDHPNDDVLITAITKDYEAQVTAAYHAYEVGDRVYFRGVTGMTEINGRSGTVTEVVDASNFKVDINSRDFGTFVSSTGVARTVAPTPPPPPVPPPVPEPTPTPPSTGGGGGTGGNVGGGNLGQNQEEY